ncbi:Flagellar motor switch protein FliG [bacterium HR21]|nr:Flagellar motor switch protein FliG [bacterium HR21]
MTAPQPIRYEQLTGRQKAAVLLLSLDVDTASHILKELEPKEVEAIVMEIANLRQVPLEVTQAVLHEYYQLVTAHSYVVEGGLEYATLLLEKSLGLDHARDIIERIKLLTSIRGFDILKKADPAQIASFLAKEHPQTIAFILSYLPPDQIADILTHFEQGLRVEVITRIATLGKVSPELVKEIESVMEQIAESTLRPGTTMRGGSQLVAAILNKSSSALAKSLLEAIEARDPALADDIKRQMFLFEDIVLIDDRGVQRILREVDKRDLALALKVADEKVRQKIFKNMSERAAAVIKEELEFMGPVRLKEVEAAQARIIEVIRRLAEQEEIVIAGRGKEEVYV